MLYKNKNKNNNDNNNNHEKLWLTLIIIIIIIIIVNYKYIKSVSKIIAIDLYKALCLQFSITYCLSLKVYMYCH